MIKIRKSEDRGHADHGWLDARHTFSFSSYHDPQFNGFRDLLVINEDRIQAGEGFGKHPHKDMEIITYILEGEIAHKDSTGSGSVIRPGDVQRMSAGRGVVHSEFNHSKEKPAHLLQIWITPQSEGIDPSYEEKKFPEQERQNKLRLLVSPTGKENSLSIHQDARVYATLLDPGKEVALDLAPGRHAWVQVARGAIELNGQALAEGDGAAISEERALKLLGKKAAEVLVFDLP